MRNLNNEIPVEQPIPFYRDTTQKTIMLKLDKTFGQNMQRKAPDNILMRYCNLCFSSRYSVILVSKSHILRINAFN